MRAPEEAGGTIKGAPGYTYTRYANPTISIFEERMALLEGAPWRVRRRPAWRP
jgi:O-acetylhomoserine/O-acetylserine sulfhydrylase-like pyridoxal-dependent enzyme